MNEQGEQDLQAIKSDWGAVGGYLADALHEVATDVGGEACAAEIASTAASEESSPNPEALKMLEESFPGSGETVMLRMSEIQQEAHQREADTLNLSRLRRFGSSLLQGFRFKS